MLAAAAILLGLAGLLGLGLAAWHARGLPRWPAGAAHGLLGLAGTLCLLIALTGPPHGGRDLAQFGVDAAALFGIALLTGLGPIIARIRRRPVSSLVLGLHATFAIMGLVVLAVYL